MKDTEAEEVMSSLPVEAQWLGGYGKQPNAYVYIDFAGRLAIIPTSGGGLFIQKENVTGDVAPWAG